MPRLTLAAIVMTFAVSMGQVVSAQGPAPLFPRHHRGIYVNRENVEIIDATPQAPPLEIDDPGVPDRGEYELNFSTGADLTKHLRHIDLLSADANYGIVLKG